MPDTFDQLCSAIEDAAVDIAAWKKVQQLGSRFMGSIGSQLASVDHADENRFWSRSTIAGLDEHLERSGPQAEPVLFAAANPQWRVFSDYDYITEEGMDRSLFYEENGQFDIRYRLAIRLIEHPSVSKAMLFFWNKKQGHPQDSEFKRLKLVSRQLRMAARASTFYASDLGREESLLDGLSAMSVAALICDGGGAVVYANECAEGILNGADGISFGGGRITSSSARTRARLSKILASAVTAATQSSLRPRGGALSISRPSGLAPYSAIIVPLRRRHQFLGPERSLALMLIRDPAGTDGRVLTEFMREFGLSPAEIEVCGLFSQNMNLRDLARLRKVSIHTVRNQLKSAMAKTGAGSQVELAALLNRIGYS